MPKEKTETDATVKAPELTLDLIERGKAKQVFDDNIRTTCRKFVNHVQVCGNKVQKCKATITLTIQLGYDKGQFTVVAQQGVKMPGPLPHADWLALTEAVGGAPTLTRGDYAGQDDDADGQEYIKETK